MAQRNSRRKRRPTPFSMGDWLSREETKSLFRQWQAKERLGAGTDNPISLTERLRSPGESSVVTNRSMEPPTPSVENPNEDPYGLELDDEPQEHYSRETEHILEVITVELETRFDLAFGKFEELAALNESTNEFSNAIKRMQDSIDDLKNQVDEALRELDRQVRFCRTEIRMLREGGPRTVGDFLALNNPP